jgi:hypothetical protein
MATGRKAFAGQSHASLIAAIISAEPPPISTVQNLTHPALDHVVRTCLAKDPNARWQTAHDVRNNKGFKRGEFDENAACDRQGLRWTGTVDCRNSD